MKKYYYGQEGKETYYAEDLDTAYEEIESDVISPIGTEIIELVTSKKSGARFCSIEMAFNPECGRLCEYYKPRNGKSGICKNLDYALKPTAAKWEIVGEYRYKKLSGRKKEEIRG